MAPEPSNFLPLNDSRTEPTSLRKRAEGEKKVLFPQPLPFVHTLLSDNVGKLEDKHGVGGDSFCSVNHLHFILSKPRKRELAAKFYKTPQKARLANDSNNDNESQYGQASVVPLVLGKTADISSPNFRRLPLVLALHLREVVHD